MHTYTNEYSNIIYLPKMLIFSIHICSSVCRSYRPQPLVHLITLVRYKYLNRATAHTHSCAYISHLNPQRKDTVSSHGLRFWPYDLNGAVQIHSHICSDRRALHACIHFKMTRAKAEKSVQIFTKDLLYSIECFNEHCLTACGSGPIFR